MSNSNRVTIPKWPGTVWGLSELGVGEWPRDADMESDSLAGKGAVVQDPGPATFLFVRRRDWASGILALHLGESR